MKIHMTSRVQVQGHKIRLYFVRTVRFYFSSKFARYRFHFWKDWGQWMFCSVVNNKGLASMTCVILLIYVIASTQNIFLFSMKVSLGLKTSSINKDQYLSSRCLKNANYFGNVLRTLFSLQNVLWRRCSLVKFIYSEKAANFCEIFPLLLTVY